MKFGNIDRVEIIDRVESRILGGGIVSDSYLDTEGIKHYWGIEIEPCPFCGGTPVVCYSEDINSDGQVWFKSYAVACPQASLRTESSGRYYDTSANECRIRPKMRGRALQPIREVVRDWNKLMTQNRR